MNSNLALQRRLSR